VHGYRALASFLGIDVAVCAAVGGRCHLRRRHSQNLCFNVQIFVDFGGGDTNDGKGAQRVHRPPPPS
jgi:hypothetical protein